MGRLWSIQGLPIQSCHGMVETPHGVDFSVFLHSSSACTYTSSQAYLLPQVIHQCSALLEGLVAGIHAEGKLGVALGVLMGTEDLGGGRQRLQLGEGCPHLLSIALKHAAAAHGKQRVACTAQTALVKAGRKRTEERECVMSRV